MSPPPHGENRYTGGGRTVRVVDVWAHNEAVELARFRGLARRFKVAAVATSIELPPPPPPSLTRTLDDSYEAVRATVDGVRSTQLGLVLVSIDDGDLPPAGRVWRFHLGEEPGEADPRRLCEALWWYTRACMPDGVCATLDGAVDVAYLVRHLHGGALPLRREEFLQRCNVLFPHLYDLKVLAEWCAVGGRDPPLAVAAAAGGIDAFRRFLELVREWRLGLWPYGYNAFMYGLGAADDQDLLCFMSRAAELDDRRRRLKELLLQRHDEEYVTRLLSTLII